MIQLDQLIQIMDFFTKILGEQTEIVIHDLNLKRIVWISNGHITERTLDFKDDETTMNISRTRALESPYKSMFIGVSSYTKGTTHLRTSTLFLNDDQGKEAYAICVNQDITFMDMMKKYLGQFDTTTVTQHNFDTEDSIESLTRHLIYEEIEKEKPFSIDSRDAKLSIIQRLEDKGVFDVKGSIPVVCELLQIAQPTLYKYLKMIKDKE